jgi:hypothetical protein
VWRDYGRTNEEVIAARFPNGVPDSTEVVILCWQEPAAKSPG